MISHPMNLNFLMAAGPDSRTVEHKYKPEQCPRGRRKKSSCGGNAIADTWMKTNAAGEMRRKCPWL
jgi:hypothetical protein